MKNDKTLDFQSREFTPRNDNNNQYRSKMQLSAQVVLITTLCSAFLGVHKIKKKGEDEEKQGRGRGAEKGNGK